MRTAQVVRLDRVHDQPGHAEDEWSVTVVESLHLDPDALDDQPSEEGRSASQFRVELRR